VESYVIRILTRKGKRAADRRTLHVPWECAIGEYEDLSNRQLGDLLKDLSHEQRRRWGEDVPPAPKKFDPYATQITEETE
jgi:hypothetical protein